MGPAVVTCCCVAMVRKVCVLHTGASQGILHVSLLESVSVEPMNVEADCI